MFNRITNILRSADVAEAPAAAPETNSTQTPSAPASATTEPTTAPVADAGAPVNPPAKTPARQAADERSERMKAQKEAVLKHLQGAKGEEKGKQDAPGETAKEQQSANPDAAAVVPDETPKERKPEATSESKPAKSDKWDKTHVIKHGDMDNEGKPVDVTVSYRQLNDALLKARFPGEYIAKMTDKEVLEIGSQQYLLQRDNNRRWNEMQGRRPAGAAAKAETTATAAVAQDASKTPPAQPATQPTASPNATTPPSTPPWQAKLDKLRESAGEDVAKDIDAVLSEAFGSLRSSMPDPAAWQSESTQLQQRLTQAEQQNNATISLLLQERFDRAFSDSAKDFPQLEGEGSETIRKDIQELWNPIATSGRYSNPWDQTQFRNSFREAVHARLGPQLKETHARQLLDNQKRQAAGQIAAQPTRTETPTAALSPKDTMKQAVLAAMRTGNIEDGKRVYGELSRTASG